MRFKLRFDFAWHNGGLGIGWFVDRRFPFGFYVLDLGPAALTLYVNRRAEKPAEVPVKREN